MSGVCGDEGGREPVIALAGCGVVGSALVRLLVRRALRQAGGAQTPCQRITVDRVLVRDTEKVRSLPWSATPGSDPSGVVGPHAFTSDLEVFLATRAPIVVEAMGGVDDAALIARATLIRGASFVTANKALVAAHGIELEHLATTHGGRLLFEAAVGGGIPIVRTLVNSFDREEITSIRGVLNGTSNFVLSEIGNGRSFDQALTDAGRLGYAEAWPTRDLDGRDSADKIAILGWCAWGVDPATIRVDVRGLLPDPEGLVRSAAARNRSVRLVAECRREGGATWASVRPEEVESGSDFGATVGVDNRVVVDTRSAGRYVFAGPGAGGPATASAVMADILSLPEAHARQPVAP